MDDQIVLSLAAAVVLVGVHLLGGRLRFLEGVPRSAWLSAFGGVSVAYVFVHLLPELAEGQEAIEAEVPPVLGFLEHHVYLVALLGLAVFYGVEQHSLRSRRERQAQDGEDRTTDGAFRLSVASFTAYNAIVGYLLLRGELEELSSLVLYTAALGVHFVINDLGLREHHGEAYHRIGRWIVSAGILAGWGIGVLAELPERAIALVLAFIGGGVVLNVLKEELPGERRARFAPFFAGAAAYTALLLLA
jgi:hypothetical protein